MIGLVHSNIRDDIRRRFPQFSATLTLLFPLHLIDANHHNLLPTLFFLPIHQHTVILDPIPLIPPYTLDH